MFFAPGDHKGDLILLASLIALPLGSCVTRSVGDPVPDTSGQLNRTLPQSLDKAVDVLFVVDNSESMQQEQATLAENFPRLIEAMRLPQLGNRLPDVHIGVVTTDLGVGNLSNMPSCERAGGDGGRLVRGASCAVQPSDPWISVGLDGRTNVGGDGDPVERVKEAFSCLARVGVSGCGIEQPLEAARRALDPDLAINRGFLRPDALLAVVFITDEDDCSIEDPAFLDPARPEFGPINSRCFAQAYDCERIPSGASVSPAQCQPNPRWLRSVDHYASRLRALKPQGRPVIVAAISGPADRIGITYEDGHPVPTSSCPGAATAEPALRIRQLVDSFGEHGQFTPICSRDFGPALQHLGDLIRVNLGPQCLEAPVLTEDGAIACDQGDRLGPDGTAVCEQSCLDRAACSVVETRGRGTAAKTEVLIDRCAPELFSDPSRTACGDRCPCWRLVRDEACADDGGAPHALEILREADPPPATDATVRCLAAQPAWDSAAITALPRCQSPASLPSSPPAPGSLQR